MKDKILLWQGSMGMFDHRAKKINEALVELLQTAGVDFTTVQEYDTSDYLRLAGDEYSFESITRKNIAQIELCGIKNIVTPCPHSYRVIKYDYPTFGGEYNVLHHSEFLLDLIKDGRLNVSGILNGQKICYHDPCRLSRDGNISAARELLKAAGAELIEAKHHSRNSMCCGGGAFFSKGELSKRIAELRMSELKASEAQKIATGCPYCLSMFYSVDKDGEIADVCELLLRAKDL